MTARRTTAAGDSAAIAPEGQEEGAAGHDAFFFEGVESPNGTIFPDVLIDRVMPHLSGAEFKVLAYVVRRTFGFKKESDAISLDQICNGIRRRDGSVLDEGTGLARKTAVAAIQGLEGKGVVLCQRRSSPEKGNLPTTFALRFRGQAANPPETNRNQGGSEMYPEGGEQPHQAGHLSPTAPGTAIHSQLTVVQPTVKQGGESVDERVTRTTRPSTPAIASTPPPIKEELSVEAIWQEVLARLAETVGAVSHRTWLAPTRLQTITADTATIEVAHAPAQRWIERHLLGAIGMQLGAVIGRQLTVRLVTVGAAVGTEALAAPSTTASAAADVGETSPSAPNRPNPIAVPAPAFSRRGGVIRRVRGTAG
jgi:hypothetical protein